ncbi:MAG: serine/threonine protein kinase, partial [Anaerolineales bacterium]|nr:serine/threonine protein kinase [Anaerolineales bacterium]
MSDLTNETLGKYHITKRLGSGGMSRVYLAQQPGLNRNVAIKVLHSHLAEDSDFVNRFEREAASIAQLRHPNITQLFDFDHDHTMGLYYMVMEYIGGPSLKSEIEERRGREEAFSLDEIVRIFSPLASAVDYAHRQGMVHRDIKPANIMFNSQGQVVLGDFGLVRIASDSHISVAGTIAGTPYYMSPEQARGESGDTRTDIYSLGVVLFELATMRLPFEGESTHSILLKHIADPPPHPTELNASIPAALEAVILKAMEKQPQDRYQTATEMAHDLRLAAGISIIDWADSIAQDTSA